ncbi:Protein Brawnin [Manis pentadactyla]|nr:Protein Brawnin [Manis pentadactyla]
MGAVKSPGTFGSTCWPPAPEAESTSEGLSPPTMPAGVSWATYLKMFSASLLAMCAGAQVVHRYYRPDLTIPEIPPKPGELKTELLGLKERQHEPQISQQ